MEIWTISTSIKRSGKGTIHSIEPLPEAFKRLHMCQALFSNVTTQIALGSHENKTFMLLNISPC